MKRKTGMLWRLLAGSLIAMPLTSYSQTETETDQLEVEMGIGNSITFECNKKLSFGVTRIALGDDANGDITLDPTSSNPSLHPGSDFDDDIVLDDDQAQLGECTLSGSAADADTSITVKFPDNAVNNTLSGAAVLGLGTPNGGTDNDAPSVTLDASTETVDANGGATIKIGGTLTINENSLSSGALGGYQGTMDVKVEIDY